MADIPEVVESLFLYVTGQSANYIPGESTPTAGSSEGSGVSTSQQTSTSSGSGNNIYVRIYLRQAKSSTAGKIKIQARAYFFYASYSSTNWATLKIYLGTSASGTKLLDTSWEWNRVVSRNDEDRKVFSQWYDLGEISNTTSDINVYALCRPTASYPEVGYQLTLKGARPSYTVTISPDSNVKNYSYKIEDYSRVYGSDRTNQTARTAIVYSGDKVTWTATPKSGYDINPRSATVTINGNHIIAIIARAMATLRMKIGGAWNMYSIYIRRGGAWVQHQAHIRTGNQWGQYS